MNPNMGAKGEGAVRAEIDLEIEMMNQAQTEC